MAIERNNHVDLDEHHVVVRVGLGHGLGTLAGGEEPVRALLPGFAYHCQRPESGAGVAVEFDEPVQVHDITSA